MIVDIQTQRLGTIGQLCAFVKGNEAVDFQPRDRKEAYGSVRDTLDRFGYRHLGKHDKGVVLKFLVAATGVSLKQTERLVRQWRCSPRTTSIIIEPRACSTSAGAPFKPPGPVIPNASFGVSRNQTPFPKPSGSIHP